MNVFQKGSLLPLFTDDVSLIYCTYFYFGNSCVKDKFFRLCQECDTVFHKSTMKRRHIRLPLIQSYPPIQPEPRDAESIPKDIKVFNWKELMIDLQKYQSLVEQTIHYHDKYQRNEFGYWREITSFVLLRGMKCLIDDRKVSNELVILGI